MYIYIRTNANTFLLKDQQNELRLRCLRNAEVRTARLLGLDLTSGSYCRARAGSPPERHTGKLLIENALKKRLPEENVHAL